MEVHSYYDFEFENLEDFDDWNNYEIGRSLSSEQTSSFNSTRSFSSSIRDFESISDDVSVGSFLWDKSTSSMSESELSRLQQNYKLKRPRIIKSDFRRTFPMHLAHVFNACSYEYLMQHINTYYVQDVTLKQRDLRPMESIRASPDDMKSSSLVGTTILSEFWYRAMHMAPDLICKIKHSFVKVRSDGTSTIRCSFVLNGTKITQLKSIEDLQHIQIYAQDTSPELPEGVSDGVAVMAAVAPGRVNTVKTHGTTVTSTTTAADSVVSASHKRTKIAPVSDAKTLHWEYTSSMHPLSSPLSEIAQMDHTAAAERYVRATQAVRHNVPKKRRKLPTSSPKADWFTLSQAAYRLDSQPLIAAKLTDQKFSIPYTQLMTLSCSVEDFNSLRAENDALLDTGLVYTAHSIFPPQPGADPQVVLTADVDILMSIEMNFNTENRIETMVLNYHT